MTESVREFYDPLAENYHLMFEDWEASIARQAAAIGPILERECGASGKLRILDCGCGIGTQSLGLALRGHRMTACDVSAPAAKRARREAAARGLEIDVRVADMLDLAPIGEKDFDAVICLDNVLPHFGRDEELLLAAAEMRGRLRAGGILLASTRPYDELARSRPLVQGPAFYSDRGRRRIVHQVWDWTGDRLYQFHLYITRETAQGWEAQHYTSRYRALLRDELTAILEKAGLVGVRWLNPAASGFYQPLVLARAPGGASTGARLTQETVPAARVARGRAGQKGRGRVSRRSPGAKTGPQREHV